MKDKPVILVVDDQPQNIELLEAHLVPQGYEVVTADGGEAALKAIVENSVDLVLLDVMMPKIDGFEVCRRIKADERLRHIPVVMITALSATDDRIKGIEAGAEDFISKPINKLEVLARVKMLLKIKSLNDRLNHAYEEINSMMNFGEASIRSFDPLNFVFLQKIDNIVTQIIRKTADAYDSPQYVIVGVRDEQWQWYRYEYVYKELDRTMLNIDLQQDMAWAGNPRIVIYNDGDLGQSELQPIKDKLDSISIPVSNMACYLSESLCIIALNYGRDVTSYDASVLNSFVMQSLFLRSLSGQILETESAFEYTVYALARASEVNDEDTGNHILRVGHYSAVIAEALGMPAKFVEAMRVQATLHDVGKMHIHPDILKKPSKLTPEEWVEMKKHTVFGAKIILAITSGWTWPIR